MQLRPYDPESKGFVERRNGWMGTSFMPGRTFSSPADFNTQLAEWLQIANAKSSPRRVGLLRRPSGDRPVRLDGRIVADHARVWARDSTTTDSAHVETARWLREQFQQPRPAPTGDDLTRDLADHDRAFGLNEEVA